MAKRHLAAAARSAPRITFCDPIVLAAIVHDSTLRSPVISPWTVMAMS